MENYLRGHFVAVTRTEWKTKKINNYDYLDPDAKGQLVIQVLHSNKERDLISVGFLWLDLFPQSTLLKGITVPDYLVAVSGHMLCVVYLKEKNERVFALYDMNEHTKSVTLLRSFVMDNALPPTAIIAIKERVFLVRVDKTLYELFPNIVTQRIASKGFPGSVGCVDLLEPKLSLQVFHEWQEQPWKSLNTELYYQKTIDAFAYDSSSPSKILLAIDDTTHPKYTFAYDLHTHPPKLKAKFNLPELVSGPNEECKFADKFGDIFVVTTESHHMMGNGTGVVVGDVHRGCVHSLLEINPYKDYLDQDGSLPLELLAGNTWSKFNSVALLNENIVLIGAGHRGIIAFAINSIEKMRLKSVNQPEDDDYGFDMKKPTLIRSLNIGTSIQSVVSVKKESFAFVLSTDESQKDQSMLSEVIWNNDESDLKVVKTSLIEGTFDKLIVGAHFVCLLRLFFSQSTKTPAMSKPYEPIPVSKSFVIALTGLHVFTYITIGFVLNLLDKKIPWWIILFSTYITEILAIATHWAGHRKIINWWYEAHMGHHLADYPPSKFITEGYEPAKKDNSKAYYPTIIFTPFVVCTMLGMWSVKIFIISFLSGALILKLADHLHQGFHSRGFYLEKHGWFQQLRALHYYHHKGNMKHNYAIGDFVFDWLVLGIQFMNVGM